MSDSKIGLGGVLGIAAVGAVGLWYLKNKDDLPNQIQKIKDDTGISGIEKAIGDATGTIGEVSKDVANGDLLKHDPTTVPMTKHKGDGTEIENPDAIGLTNANSGETTGIQKNAFTQAVYQDIPEALNGIGNAIGQASAGDWDGVKRGWDETLRKWGF